MRFSRERSVDAHEECEERERRWNRIFALLEREDLISNSSSSTGTNQYQTGSGNTSLNNGITHNIASGD